MRTRLFAITLAAAVPLLVSSTARCQAPEQLDFQGFLTDAADVPIDAPADLVFTLYDTTGASIWTETQLGVTVADGVFSVHLGAVNPLLEVAFDQPLELGVKAGTDPEMVPRTELTTAPYALSLRSFRVYPVSGDEAPNLVGGANRNSFSSGIHGATISGGGTSGGYSYAFGCFGELPGQFDYRNWVGGSYGTVSGGIDNQACGLGTVAGGRQNFAKGGSSSIMGGEGNATVGWYSSIAGGFYNRAEGNYTFAAGYKARAKHEGSFVWSDHSVTSGIDSVLTTAANQFIVRAAGGVGINTNAPLNEFHVVGNHNASASIPNHVAVIDNISTGDGADVLALRMGISGNPANTNSFITFIHNTTAAGFIRGNGAGTVELVAGGADYAEYLPHRRNSDVIDPGSVVGVFSGAISLETDRADQIMVVSTSSIVVGNHKTPDEGDPQGYSKVAFIGQAPVKVRGSAKAGDFLIASGLEDGTAVAIHPADVTPEELSAIFATAWEDKPDVGVGQINAAIGIDQAAASKRVIEALQGRVSSLDKRLAAVERRMMP